MDNNNTQEAFFNGLTVEGHAKGRAVLIKSTAGNWVLNPQRSQSRYNHSPDGFNWGYSGSGPAQLALAIMLEFCPTESIALSCYQQFKDEVIAPLKQGQDFVIQGRDILAFLLKTGR